MFRNVDNEHSKKQRHIPEDLLVIASLPTPQGTQRGELHQNQKCLRAI
jgi:hypothetical protein